LSDDEVKQRLPHLRVVSRAFPTDKSRLVKLAKELGLVVGMTGDGVNDAPAVKNADVGFAMGSGTEMTKESGDIVILDDNFSSLTKAVLYGRTLVQVHPQVPDFPVDRRYFRRIWSHFWDRSSVTICR
jgi:Ca2+-transporting ATPase